MSLFTPFQNADSTVLFKNRQEAGQKLAQAVLDDMTRNPVPQATRCIVYALPRGGLPVAEPVAHALGCPLDVIVAKKITRPDNCELAIGAVTTDGHVVWASPRLESQSAQFDSERQQAQAHAQAQLSDLAAASPRFSPTEAIALVIDDGIATGMTITAAVEALRAQQPTQVWICAPVAPADLRPFLDSLADRVILLATPHPFHSVSRFYREFAQVTTEEAATYLQQNH